MKCNPFQIRIPKRKTAENLRKRREQGLLKQVGPARGDANDPPLLMLHGDQDPQMPINQSHELEGRYRAIGLPCEFVTVYGAAHGGPAFNSPDSLQLIDTFLRSHLKD